MELFAGGYEELDCMSDFTITITLTKKGLKDVEKVIDAVFKYIKRLQELGPKEWVFNEKKNIGNIAFDFAEKGDPLGYTVGLAEKMQHFKNAEDISHLLRHSYVADEFRPDLIN